MLFLEDNEVSAEVFFKKGHLRHARNKTATGNEVIYQLVTNRKAQIRWERNSTSTEDSIDNAAENALLDRLGLLAEISAQVQKPPTGELKPPPAARNGHSAIVETREIALDRPTITRSNLTTGSLAEIVAANASTAETGSPNGATSQNGHQPLDGMAETTEKGTEQFRDQLGDEVLRPPRFRSWSGLPLPFVSAFVFSPDDGLVKTAYDTLWKAHFSGFVSLVFPQSEGFSLLYKGLVVHSRFADDNSQAFLKDQEALRRITAQRLPANETNSLLVYPLEPEFVHSFSALIIGEPELNSMSSQSVKLNKLLNTLEQADRTGVVRINSSAENGYIFLYAGHKLGSYYEVEEVLEESILRVYQIVTQPDSTIEVLISPSQDKLFDYASRPRSVRETKLELIELAEEIFGKRSNRVVQLLIQSEETIPALVNCCNQARRVAQQFIDKNLADGFFKRAMQLLQEPG